MIVWYDKEAKQITSTTTWLDPLACLVFEVTLYQSTYTSRMMLYLRYSYMVDELKHTLFMSTARVKDTRSAVNVTDILKLKMN